MERFLERRREPRYPGPIQVKEINRWPVPLGAGHLLDINPLGCRLEIAIPLAPPKDRVDLTFVLPGEEKETRVLAEVVWLDFGRASEGFYTLGISFIEPQWELARLGQP